MPRIQAGWNDFEAEPDTTGDGSGDPDKHYLTIVLDPGEDNEEIAVIVHRTCDGKYPLDGSLANRKRRLAQVIVEALNSEISVAEQTEGIYETHAERLCWTDEEGA